MFKRQMYKFQKGKRGLLVFGESAFILLVLGSMIFAIDQGNSVYYDLKTPNIQNAPLGSAEGVMDLANDLEYSDWVMGFLMTPVMLVTEFPQMSANIALIDQSLGGWLMHFYTVGIVEYIELLGILIFYKISFRQRLASTITSGTFAKTAI